MHPTFKYSVTSESNKTILQVATSLPAFNRVVLFVLGIFSIGFSGFLAYMVLTGEPPLAAALFLSLLIIVSLFIAFFGVKSALGSLNYQIILDKGSKILTTKNAKTLINNPKDEFSSKFSDIKDIQLTERQNLPVGIFAGGTSGGAIIPIPTGSSSAIKVITTHGEKTLAFPLESFNKGEEIIRKIKDEIK